MKNGKNPTRGQKKMLREQNLNYEHWLIVKDTPQAMTIVHRQSGEVRNISKFQEG